jgi:hypothetical protein
MTNGIPELPKLPIIDKTLKFIKSIGHAHTPKSEMPELSKEELIERLTACQSHDEKLLAEKAKQRPRILCAAIWFIEQQTAISNPIGVTTGMVLCGHSHVHCRDQFIALTGKYMVIPQCGKYIQGFLTSDNRFVTRQEAATIAWVAGQIDSPRTILYSEDLY